MLLVKRPLHPLDDLLIDEKTALAQAADRRVLRQGHKRAFVSTHKLFYWLSFEQLGNVRARYMACW